jgi:hypothetical protein
MVWGGQLALVFFEGEDTARELSKLDTADTILEPDRLNKRGQALVPILGYAGKTALGGSGRQVERDGSQYQKRYKKARLAS